MRNLILCLTFGMIATLASAQNPNPSSSLSNTIISEMNLEQLPGLSTVIVKGGEIVWIESFGFADIPNSVTVTDTTAFLLASISKLFTGTALMQLADDGSIDLDEDINNYLPFSIEIPGFESDSITFRQLMTHTSSIEDGNALDSYYSVGDPTLSLADCMQRYFSTSGADYNTTQNFHNNPPGTIYDYSNIATALSGYLVEVISGMPFDQYCRNNLFNPLCMNNTDWHLSYFDTNYVARPHQFTGGQYSPYTHYGFADYPNGLLRADIQDLSNFMIAYLNNGTLNGNTVLSATAVSEMLSTQVPSLEPTQGLNWYTEVLYTPGSQVTVWGHNGGEDGVSTDLYIDPNTDIGIAVISNGEGDCLAICDELYSYALGLSVTGVGVTPCSSSSSIEERGLSESFVYPNPFSNTTLISFQNPKNESVHIKVIDAYGRTVSKSDQTNGNEIMLEKKQLPPGIYFYSVENDESKVLSNGKLIIL